MGGYRPFSTLVDGRPEGEVFSEEFGQYINPVAEEKRFLGELKDIRKITDSFDLVMFPVDGRIGNGYTLGGRQFIDRFKVGMFVPMHFVMSCLLYTSPSPRDVRRSRMPSSA